MNQKKYFIQSNSKQKKRKTTNIVGLRVGFVVGVSVGVLKCYKEMNEKLETKLASLEVLLGWRSVFLLELIQKKKQKKQHLRTEYLNRNNPNSKAIPGFSLHII